jgi:hypothetical protein
VGSLRILDVLALAASGEAAKEMHAFLKGMREDLADAISGIATVYHKNTARAITTANASDLATCIALANAEKVELNLHFPSNGVEGVHATASAQEITTSDASDLSTAINLSTELKANYNSHLTEGSVHLVNDTTNSVTSADATDLSSLITLLNEIKGDYNAHMAGAMQTPKIKDE